MEKEGVDIAIFSTRWFGHYGGGGGTGRGREGINGGLSKWRLTGLGRFGEDLGQLKKRWMVEGGRWWWWLRNGDGRVAMPGEV